MEEAEISLGTYSLSVASITRPMEMEYAWFVTEVMPLLRDKKAGVRLHIVGSNAPDDIRALASADVIFHGYISDEELEQRYAEAGLAIAPLRFGGGMKGKVLEAMATGIPLVSTKVGVQGVPNAEQSPMSLIVPGSSLTRSSKRCRIPRKHCDVRARLWSLFAFTIPCRQSARGFRCICQSYRFGNSDPKPNDANTKIGSEQPYQASPPCASWLIDGLYELYCIELALMGSS